MYTSICWYLRVLPVLHRPEVVDIGVNTIYKNMPYAEYFSMIEGYSPLGIWHVFM